MLLSQTDLQLIGAGTGRWTVRLQLVTQHMGLLTRVQVTKGRPLAVYRSNLLDHIGAQSSFAVRTNRLPWPGCFDSMATVWSLHKSERFQVQLQNLSFCACSVLVWHGCVMQLMIALHIIHVC